MRARPGWQIHPVVLCWIVVAGFLIISPLLAWPLRYIFSEITMTYVFATAGVTASVVSIVLTTSLSALTRWQLSSIERHTLQFEDQVLASLGWVPEAIDDTVIARLTTELNREHWPDLESRGGAAVVRRETAGATGLVDVEISDEGTTEGDLRMKQDRRHAIVLAERILLEKQRLVEARWLIFAPVVLCLTIVAISFWALPGTQFLGSHPDLATTLVFMSAYGAALAVVLATLALGHIVRAQSTQ